MLRCLLINFYKKMLKLKVKKLEDGDYVYKTNLFFKNEGLFSTKSQIYRVKNHRVHSENNWSYYYDTESWNGYRKDCFWFNVSGFCVKKIL